MSEEQEEVTIPSKEELLGVVEETAEAIEEAVEEVDASPEADDYSEVEQEAMALGWNPEGVEGKRNLSAEEFVDRQKLYDDIRALKKQNKRLSGDVENITKYQERREKQVREDERNKLLETLKTQKVQALQEEDYHKVAEIDDQIADERGKAAQEAKEEEAQVRETSPEFDSWVEGNSWYNQDIDLKVEADMLGEKYWRENPEKNLEDVFEYVGKTIRKLNPDKFENQRRKAPSAVESSENRAPRAKSKAKYKASDLPQEEQAIMRTVIRATKGMTEERYLKEYFEG